MHSEKSGRRTNDESPDRHLVAGACERAESHSTGASGCQPLRLASAAWGLLGLCLLALPLRVGAAVPTGTDRTALEALYDATDGDSWTTSTNWKTTDGDWHGVTTDVDGNVLELRLSRNKLTGTIPAAVWTLIQLTQLRLNNNQLSGTIPAAVGDLTQLTGLRLHNNQLTGTIPAAVWTLTQLTQLFLHNNQLSGTIPAAAGDLKNLIHLYLHDNKLSGAIPMELGSLRNILHLDLHKNDLNGAIPAALGSLRHLTILRLDTNKLNGAIPAELEDLTALNGTVQEAAYGTGRVDTADICGDTDNGFGLLFNWNLLGAGEHTVVATVDGIELDRTTVTVTTLGEEFVRGAEGSCTVSDFPLAGETAALVWQQSKQNFVLAAGAAPSGANQAGTPGVGYLENPSPNSFQSSIGVISGWVCAADEVVIAIGDLGSQGAGYGTERLDTQEVCEDTDNGFGLLFNWNLLGEGEHEVVAYVDGAELGRATVRVTTLGAEFLRGVEGECVVEDFPTAGERVTLEWQQNSQNFVITDVE